MGARAGAVDEMETVSSLKLLKLLKLSGVHPFSKTYPKYRRQIIPQHGVSPVQ
jgi:hypothetical protein